MVLQHFFSLEEEERTTLCPPPLTRVEAMGENIATVPTGCSAAAASESHPTALCSCASETGISQSAGTTSLEQRSSSASPPAKTVPTSKLGIMESHPSLVDKDTRPVDLVQLTSSGPLLCCGPPEAGANKREQQALSADMFLTQVTATPQDPAAEHILLPLFAAIEMESPSLSGSLACQSKTGAHTIEQNDSPRMDLMGSPKAASAGPAFNAVPERRELPSSSSPSPAACSNRRCSLNEISQCDRNGCDFAAVPLSVFPKECAPRRFADAHRPPPLQPPPNIDSALSKSTTSLVGTAASIPSSAPAAFHAAASNSSIRTVGGSEAALALDYGLPRTVSTELFASVSSSHCRPIVRNASVGQLSMQGTAPGTVSAVTTSVTCTRKNMCRGAAEAFGSPLISLSTRPAQRLRWSFDNEETENSLEERQRHTLSLQNLKAHTQQVGEMGPEDRVKRFRSKRDGMMYSRGVSQTSKSRLRHTYTLFSSSGTSATTLSAAAAAKLQVDSLKDCLQECHFLSLRDVMNAIADTQAHELRDAQKQIASVSTIATDVAGADESFSSIMTGGMHTAQSTSSTLKAPRECSEPSMQSNKPHATPTSRSAGLKSSETHRLSTAEPEKAFSFTACDTESCGCASASATSAMVAAAPPANHSHPSLDAHQALTLAAAITEVSLNLERSAEPSLTGSITLPASPLQHFPVASHYRLSRGGSSCTLGMSVGDRASCAVLTASPPNTNGEPAPSAMAMKQRSNVATPLGLRSTALSDYQSTTPPVQAQHTTVVPLKPSHKTVTVPDSAVYPLPKDPLERKVRCSLSEDFDSVECQTNWERAELVNTSTVPPPASPTAKTNAKMITLSSSTAHGCAVPVRPSGGEHIANWSGLCIADEEKDLVKHNRRLDASPEITEAGQRSTSLLRKPQNQQKGDPMEAKAQALAGDAAPTVTDSEAPLCETDPIGCGSQAASDTGECMRTIRCFPFEDELYTTTQLRQWARATAPSQQASPSTTTEVTT